MYITTYPAVINGRALYAMYIMANKDGRALYAMYIMANKVSELCMPRICLAYLVLINIITLQLILKIVTVTLSNSNFTVCALGLLTY